MASAHLGMKNFDAAWLNAKRAMELAPGDTVTLTFAAEVALLANRPQEALAIARTVQKQAKTYAAGWYLEGQIELARGQPDAAIAALRKAMLKVPDTKTATALHRALLSAKKDAEAAQHADSWLKAHPADMEFLLQLGIAAQQRKDTAVAEQRYRQMLALQPNNLETLNNLAQLLAEQELPGAVALAKLLIQAGEKKPAIANLTKLSKYGPEFAKQDEVSKLLKDLGG